MRHNAKGHLIEQLLDTRRCADGLFNNKVDLAGNAEQKPMVGEVVVYGDETVPTIFCRH